MKFLHEEIHFIYEYASELHHLRNTLVRFVEKGKFTL